MIEGAFHLLLCYRPTWEVILEMLFFHQPWLTLSKPVPKIVAAPLVHICWLLLLVGYVANSRREGFWQQKMSHAFSFFSLGPLFGSTLNIWDFPAFCKGAVSRRCLWTLSDSDRAWATLKCKFRCDCYDHSIIGFCLLLRLFPVALGTNNQKWPQEGKRQTWAKLARSDRQEYGSGKLWIPWPWIRFSNENSDEHIQIDHSRCQ